MFLDCYASESSLIVVAPGSLRKLILKERLARFPRMNLKVLSKEDLLRGLTFDWDARTVEETSEFLQKNLAIAAEVVSLLPILSISKGKVPPIYANLLKHLDEKGFLYRRPSFKSLFHGQKTVVFAYSQYDRELANIIALLGLEPVYHAPNCLGSEAVVHSFFDEKSELVALFERISCDLSQGIVGSPSSISLLLPPDYEKEARRLSMRYSLPINGLDGAFLNSFPSYKEFAKSLRNGLTVEDSFASIGANETAYGEKRILAALLSKLSPFRDRLPLYLKLLDFEARRTKVSPQPYKDGINVVSFNEATPYLPHLYVVGFNAPAFPPSHKDDGLLSTTEKDALGMNGAPIENRIFADATRALLRLDPKRYISMVDKNDQTGDEKPPFRPYVMESAPKREDGHLPKKGEKRQSYSALETRFLSARGKDNLRLYRKASEEAGYYSDGEIGYRLYDHSFTGAKVALKMPLRLSYSNLDEYLKCPFRFYLDRCLLPLDKTYSFESSFGSLFHEALKVERDGKINWDFVRDEAQVLFDGRDLDCFLALGKTKFAGAVAMVNESFRHSSAFCDEPMRESKYEYAVSDDLVIKGFIDKTFIDRKKKRLVIVDFKTGSFSFSFKKALAGNQLQLPTYLLLLEKNLPDYQAVGAFIEPIKGFGQGEEHPFKLDGIFLDEEEAMAALDCDLKGGEASNLVAGLKLKINGDYAASNRRISRDDMRRLREAAESFFLMASDEIRSMEFPIAPKRTNGRTPCELCGLRDVCFRSEDDIVEESNDDEEEDDRE